MITVSYLIFIGHFFIGHFHDGNFLAMPSSLEDKVVSFYNQEVMKLGADLRLSFSQVMEVKRSYNNRVDKQLIIDYNLLQLINRNFN
jgi:hypothetical protein